MCQPFIDEESAEVYRAVSENKVGLVTQMITDKGLAKASRQLNMSPLRASDMNPMTYDDDDDVTSTSNTTYNNDDNVTAAVAEEQKQYYHPRPRQSAPAYMAPGVDNTETFEQPAEISQAKDLPVFRNIESPYPSYDGQEFEHYPRSSKSVFKRPMGRHVKTPERMLRNPNPFATNQV